MLEKDHGERVLGCSRSALVFYVVLSGESNIRVPDIATSGIYISKTETNNPFNPK